VVVFLGVLVTPLRSPLPAFIYGLYRLPGAAVLLTRRLNAKIFAP
jgi:hypothetical protein